MDAPAVALRTSGTRMWHWHPGCPEYPTAKHAERMFGWPPGELLCGWCGSRGSGKPDLDDRAQQVLAFLRDDTRLRALGARAERVAWQYGDARFLFSGLNRAHSPVISRMDLRGSHPVEVADSLIRWAERNRDLRNPQEAVAAG